WFFFFEAEDGIRDWSVTGVQTCALPICRAGAGRGRSTDVLGELLEQLRLALGPDQALLHLAVLDDEERRDAHHLVAAGDVRVVGAWRRGGEGGAGCGGGGRVV